MPFDVVEILAKPLPVKVIAGLLGVPADALDRFPGWSMQLARFFTGPLPQPDIARDLDDALSEWREFVSDLIDRRSAEPQDDFVSVVAGAISDGRMTRQDGIAIVVHSLQAGHETSTNLMATVIFLLLGHPEQLELARSSAQWLEYAIEEVLRYEPPAINGRRMATRAVSLGGQAIHAGDTVVFNIAAAPPRPGPVPRSREVRHHAAAHEGRSHGLRPWPAFLPWRIPRRLEVPIAVDEFLRRFPAAALVSQAPRWRTPRDQRGLAELWVDPHGAPIKAGDSPGGAAGDTMARTPSAR